MITSKKAELDQALDTVLGKIEAGTITCEDFNGLINKTMIGETSPEAVRDRVRRRTTRNETDTHIEPETGHQSLTLPTMADRVQPKVKPVNQQNHGRARIAHAHSARTQSRLQSAVEFIEKNQGKPITEDVLSTIPNREILQKLTAKLMARPGVDRDWLQELLHKLDES